MKKLKVHIGKADMRYADGRWCGAALCGELAFEFTDVQANLTCKRCQKLAKIGFYLDGFGNKFLIKLK